MAPSCGKLDYWFHLHIPPWRNWISMLFAHVTCRWSLLPCPTLFGHVTYVGQWDAGESDSVTPRGSDLLNWVSGGVTTSCLHHITIIIRAQPQKSAGPRADTQPGVTPNWNWPNFSPCADTEVRKIHVCYCKSLRCGSYCFTAVLQPWLTNRSSVPRKHLGNF